MNAVFLEFPDEADGFLAHCRQTGVAPDSFHVVALWPNVQAVLRRNGVTYVDTRPYFDNDSHRRIVLTSEEWLQEIEKVLNLEDDSGIRETYNSAAIFHLRFYINYFLWILEVLEGFAGRNEVRAITIFSETSSAPKPAGPSLNMDDRPVSPIIRAFASGRGIQIQTIPAITRRAAGKRPPVAQRIKKASLDMLGAASPLLHRLSLARIRPGQSILVNDISYNMDRLIRELKGIFPGVNWIWLQTYTVPPAASFYGLLRHGPVDYYVAVSALKNGSTVGNSSSRLLEGLDRLARYLKQASFEKAGVSFARIFQAKVEHDLLPYIRELSAKSQIIRNVLERTKPSLVLSPFAAEADSILGEWTQILGIPSMSISHGTFTPSESKVDEIEKVRLGSSLILTSYRYTALQTPWAEEFVTRLEPRKTPQPIRTGNLIFARLDERLRSEVRRELFGDAADRMKLIVYATTLKPRSSLRFQIHETLDEHLEGIADLATAVKSVPDAALLVKLHPAAALKEDEVRELAPETRSDRVRIACRMPFERVLSAADLLVSYSSTCIEEAILNNIPVLLYDPWDRYQHLFAYRWGTQRGTQGGTPGGRPGGTPGGSAPAPRSHPAYHVNHREFLVEALDWILKNHNPRSIPAEVWRQYVFPSETRDEFVRFVADSLAQGSSAVTAVHGPARRR